MLLSPWEVKSGVALNMTLYILLNIHNLLFDMVKYEIHSQRQMQALKSKLSVGSSEYLFVKYSNPECGLLPLLKNRGRKKGPLFSFILLTGWFCL